MFVLDKSSSMTHPLEGGNDTPKWNVAKDALNSMTTEYERTMQLGLNVFPAAGECSAGEAVVAPKFDARGDIMAALAEPPPEGGNWTPMAETLEAVAGEPMLNDPNSANYVVLITDGWQYCIPYEPETRFAPVDSIESLNQAGITTFVVGFGASVDTETLSQMAVAAGTARSDCDQTGTDPERPCYYQADSPDELLTALMDVASQIPDGEVCDELDNDCDGQVDEDIEVACSNECGSGFKTCSGGMFSGCIVDNAPAEVCDGLDNDCDGFADEADDEVDGLCGPDYLCSSGECVPAMGPEAAGCGCQATDNGDLAGLMLLGLGLLLFQRRRRGVA
jgi:MYXO-CTERM domain-containing protein